MEAPKERKLRFGLVDSKLSLQLHPLLKCVFESIIWIAVGKTGVKVKDVRTKLISTMMISWGARKGKVCPN